MLIQCKLIREGGSDIDLTQPGDSSSTIYHFSPNDKGHHVAEVENEDHIDILLSIEEAYVEYGTEKTVFDISKMSKKKLILYAADHEIEIDASADVETIREQISAAG